MFEGSRAFDLAWGAIAGTICLAIGIAMIVAWVDAYRHGGTSLFGADRDPGRGLHLAWAIVALSMAGTNYGCRFIDHNYLSGVHETFLALTLVVYAVLIPRVLAPAIGRLKAR